MQNGALSDIYGDNKVKLLEDLEKYNKELMSYAEEVYDLIEETMDMYVESLQAATEEIDKQISTDIYEQLLDEEIASDWVRYRTLAHEAKEIEEKLEELMLKLETFN